MNLSATVTVQKVTIKNSLYEMLKCGTALIVTLTLVLLANTAQAESTAPLNDKEITNAITDELLLDPGISSQRIVVNTDNGIVTLSGAVNNFLPKTGL